MNKLYQLGEYNTRTDLTSQGTMIRDLVLSNHDYKTLRELVESIDYIEEESIIILKRAILAGYWYSYYGFGWTKEQEVDFWELVYSKNKDSGVAILTLAQSYRVHGIKTLKDSLPMYFKAIELNDEHYHSLSDEDLEELRTDDDVRYKLIRIELDNYEKNWGRAEFEMELPFLIMRCKGDETMEDYVKKRIESILKNK